MEYIEFRLILTSLLDLVRSFSSGVGAFDTLVWHLVFEIPGCIDVLS